MIGEDRKLSYKRLFIEILDAIKDNTEQRFNELPVRKFLYLLDSRHFQQFNKHFSESELSCPKQSYRQYFVFESLKSELTVIFQDTEMYKNIMMKLCKHLVSFALIQGLKFKEEWPDSHSKFRNLVKKKKKKIPKDGRLLP